MIGHFSNKIKSRKHPEENLLNRYLRSVATRSVGFGDDNPHPLVNHGTRNSSAMIDRTVVWPENTKAKTKKHQIEVLSVGDAVAAAPIVLCHAHAGGARQTLGEQ